MQQEFGSFFDDTELAGQSVGLVGSMGRRLGEELGGEKGLARTSMHIPSAEVAGVRLQPHNDLEAQHLAWS